MKLVSVNNFDAIETFTHHSNLIGLPIAAAAGIPIRIASHHGRINAFPHWLEWIHTRLINSKKTTILVAVSEGVYKASIEEGVISQKIIKIPNGISISAINQNAGISARSELGVPDDSFLILSVGRLSFEKGHIFLLQSVPVVIERFPKTQFIIAGDGLLKSKLEAEADRLGITDSFRFLGIRTDVPQLLAASDIFVLPSRSEGLPMALLEAMAMSVPVIATDVGGINQVVKNQVTGLLIPSEDPVAIAESINELLEDKSKRTRLARAAKEIVVKNYSMEKMCLEYERLFNGEEEL